MANDKYITLSSVELEDDCDPCEDPETGGVLSSFHTGGHKQNGKTGSNNLTEVHTGDLFDDADGGGDTLEHNEGSDELFGLDEESSTVTKLYVLSRQSAPVIASFFLGLLGSFFNLLFAGRYVSSSGDHSVVFAGISLANMFVNVSCFSLLLGMSSAVETLGSQHNGAGNYVKVGLVLQRSFAVLTAMTLPMLVLWYFVYDLYLFIGVDPEVCEVIRTYVYIRALALPIDIVNESWEKYLMSIGVMEPSMWSNVSFIALILSFNSLFVIRFKWGYASLAVSWVISTYLSSFVQIGLSLRYPAVQRTLQPLDWRAFDDWKEFILLGLPGTVMLCSEWWAFEFLMLLATFLGTAQVAAQAIILQISSIAFMVPLGIGVTCASLVGNSIGAGKLTLAKQVGKISLIYSAGINAVLGVLILLVGDQFVSLFTQDPAVIRETDSAIPFLSMFVMIDGLQGVASGVLRGTGKQFIGAVANVIAYYGAGLPMAYALCFRLNRGVDGLIMGIACGSLVQVTVLFVLIFGFESYLFDSAVLNTHTTGGFKPVSLDESTHDTTLHDSTGDIEMIVPSSAAATAGGGSNGHAVVLNHLHITHNHNSNSSSNSYSGRIDVRIDDEPEIYSEHSVSDDFSI